MSRHRFFLVDVFAERKYAGNQLAVVDAQAAPLGDQEMQAIAREMNFSETTFLVGRRGDGWGVRIFTPTREIPFAGHPTLGTAWVIRNEIDPTRAEHLVLELGAGAIPIVFEEDAVWMEPPKATFGAPVSAEPAARMLGLAPEDVDSRAPVQHMTGGIPFLFVPLRSLNALRRARIDVERRAALVSDPLAAVFLFTAESHEPGNQFAARMFFEANGVREDPATGSANGALGAYLVEHFWFGDADVDVRVEQGYEIGRPSLLFLRAARREDEIYVCVGGRVELVGRGELV